MILYATLVLGEKNIECAASEIEHSRLSWIRVGIRVERDETSDLVSVKE